APRYQGAEGRVLDAGRVTVDVAENGMPVRATATIIVRDQLPQNRNPESPSHGVRVTPAPSGLEITLLDQLADGKRAAPGEMAVPLDRDLVLRWAVARPTPGLSLQTGRPKAGDGHADAAYGMLTVTPPTPENRPAVMPRDLIVLLDASGSMAGVPLAQAHRVVAALVEALTDADHLELIEFSNKARRWRPTATAATSKVRQEALRWLAGIRAGGGTEMLDGVKEALTPLRADAQRQVVLVTDGLVGFESEIVSAVAQDLPPNSRLHVVVVGSAPNRALGAPAARAGRGIEVVIGVDEEPTPAIARLLSHMQAPVLTEVRVEGPALLAHAPARLPDVYAGAPLRFAVKLRPEGGELLVRGKTLDGSWEGHVDAPMLAHGEGSPAVARLYGREAVLDLEMREAAGLVGQVDTEIEQLGIAFQIATRATAWVAVSEEPTVDPTTPI